MKIAFIVDLFPKLSETFILNQITGLIDLGHEVDIFARSNPCEKKVHREVEEYQLMARTHYFLDPRPRRVRLPGAALLLLRNFHKGPRKIIWSFIVAKRFNLRRLGARQYVLPFLGKSYDIIHCHFGPMGFVGYFLKKLGVTGKVVVSFYGFDISRWVKSEGEAAYDLLFENADLITSISEHVKGRLINLGCDPAKIEKVSMGVDLREFPFLERKLDEGGKVRVLTVARLVEKKGIEYSIKAVAKLVKLKCKIEYAIVGDGPLRVELESIISALGVDGQVKLLGWREASEVIELYGEAHLVVLSSITAQDGDEEGQGLVLQEAQAMGLPVIATRHNGIPEGVLDGVSAFLVPERDVDALAERLDYLIQHPELWPEMGRAGRRFVEENYDARKLNQRLVEIYQGLVEERDVVRTL